MLSRPCKGTRVLGAVLSLHALAQTALAQTAWTPLPPGPGARSDVAAIFDPARGQLLVSCGWNGTTNLDETWAFDGAAWTLLAPFPGLNSSHRLGFLPAQSAVIAFGGWNGTTMLNGTTAWDGVAWTARAPLHSPSPRYSHAMVADTARSVLVLFGGYCGTNCALDDTWEYDGVDWTQHAVPFRPTGRFSAGMAFDSARNYTLLFGGRTVAGRVNDTWTWDGSAWTSHGSGGPSARSTPSMDYDSIRQRVVLFGGFTGAVYANDTWEHDGVSWTQRAPATPPTGRGFAAMAFDDGIAATVLFGGDTGSGVTALLHAYAPVNPATLQFYGRGCGSVTMNVTALPWLGDTCRVVAGNLGAGTGAFFAVGLSDTVWGANTLPLDLTTVGMPGCMLAAAPDVSLLVAASGGLAELALPIPNDVALLGLPFFVQALADDASLQPAGLALSAAARAVIGAR